MRTLLLSYCILMSTRLDQTTTARLPTKLMTDAYFIDLTLPYPTATSFKELASPQSKISLRLTESMEGQGPNQQRTPLLKEGKRISV